MLKGLFKSDIQDFEVAELTCNSAIKDLNRLQMICKTVALCYTMNWKSLVILHPSIREFLRVN
jgi:hypothetical protein